MHETYPEANARLCVPGLPSLTDTMLAGGVYAVIAEMPPSRIPLLVSSLEYAGSTGLNCSIIVASNPAAFLERIDAFGVYDSGQALHSGQLQVLVRQDNFAKNMFRFGAQRFSRELDHFGIPDNSFLIFDQADELFSLHDISLAMEQLEALRQWFGKHHVTGLMIFSRLNSNAADTLQAMMDQLSGVVKISSARQGLELTFDYWQSPEGTIAARQFPLQTGENGLYKIAAHVESEAEELETPVGGPHKYFYMDEDLASLGSELPGDWQQVSSMVGILHATRGLHSATVLLNYQRDTDLRELAETAHTLRLSLGKKAHIVIREKQASLRYQNEALLLRLGVNLVIHRDIPEARLALLLGSLQGQNFTRNVDIDFEVALASVIPSGVRGYLLPGRFVKEARLILERGAALNIPCALVIGELVRGAGFTDLLANISISRPGDLLSSDGKACYFFFNACPESALSLTLERILGGPVGSAFYEASFMTDRQDIAATLATLAVAAREKQMPDYSSYMSAQTELLAPEPGIEADIVPAKSVTNKKTKTPVLHNAVLEQSDAIIRTVLQEYNTSPAVAGTGTQDAANEPLGLPVNQQYTVDNSAANQHFGKRPAPRAVRAGHKKQTD